jgi:hypothetical protein
LNKLFQSIDFWRTIKSWSHSEKLQAVPPWDADFGMWETVVWEFISYRCKTHKHSSKYAKFYTKKFVKYLSKCKFYKKYGNTSDSTENTVESSVLQSRKFHIKDHWHYFTSLGLNLSENKFHLIFCQNLWIKALSYTKILP